MKTHRISHKDIHRFLAFLHAEDRCEGTVKKYRRDLRTFTGWLGEQAVQKKTAVEWKYHLLEEKYAPTTVNSMLAAVNAFFKFMGWHECRVKFLKVQHCVFRAASRELSCSEYDRLRSVAAPRTKLLMESMGATGIRVGEVRFLTVEAAKNGSAVIAHKGKIRTILLPQKLCRKLLKYAKSHGIASGAVFLTKSAKPLTPRQIWAEMKALCGRAGVEDSKVFPHNLRHLFAREYFRVYKDIVKLADILGHSSIQTTRIYLVTTGREHARQLDQLGLVS